MMDPPQSPSHATGSSHFQTPPKSSYSSHSMDLNGLVGVKSMESASHLGAKSSTSKTIPLADINKLCDAPTPEAVKSSSVTQGFDVLSASPSHLASSLAATRPPAGAAVFSAVIPSGPFKGKRVEEVLNDLEVTKEENKTVKDENKELFGRLALAESSIDTYKALVDTANSASREKATKDALVKGLKDDLARTQQRLAEMQQDFQDVDASYQKLHSRFTRQRSHIDNYVENERKLKAACAQLTGSNEELQAKYTEMQQALVAMENECNTHIQQSQLAQEKETAAIKLQVKTLSHQRDVLTRDVAQKAKDMAELQEICDQLMQAMDGQ
eukprot:TRINITY_DN3078_c0_g1_i1.p1 TRINITY_DN3078_c0_g1~~TRINITY_DN3078_c0_g1_i1.p1  ORF type:complete len:327 (+),score=93.43 TRINITY_DN3078_c0_g1_i1:92-1072(+)